MVKKVPYTESKQHQARPRQIHKASKQPRVLEKDFEVRLAEEFDPDFHRNTLITEYFPVKVESEPVYEHSVNYSNLCQNSVNPASPFKLENQ